MIFMFERKSSPKLVLDTLFLHSPPLVTGVHPRQRQKLRINFLLSLNKKIIRSDQISLK